MEGDGVKSLVRDLDLTIQGRGRGKSKTSGCWLYNLNLNLYATSCPQNYMSNEMAPDWLDWLNFQYLSQFSREVYSKKWGLASQFQV